MLVGGRESIHIPQIEPSQIYAELISEISGVLKSAQISGKCILAIVPDKPTFCVFILIAKSLCGKAIENTPNNEII